jgi:Fic family protein
LEQFIHADDDIDPLIKVAVIHYQFESIHPFCDGNGRSGRILMMLYLLYTKKLDYPVLFLSHYINQTRPIYYDLLAQTNHSNDYTDFILYILQGIIEQSEKTQQKILAINALIQNLQNNLAEH